MFEAVRYVQNSFAIAFPRQHDIRRKVNDFEDFLQTHLEGHYQQPMLIPVPDEMDPEIPRLIFGSRHGFSQIVFSQIGLSLNVDYSPDWQLDVSKGRQYLLERAPVLFDLLSILDNIKPFFSGLTTKIRLPVKDARQMSQAMRAAQIRVLRRKYQHLLTPSDEFARRKQEEIALESEA